MNDLKPCPFCGGKAKTEQVERWYYGTVYRVGCNTDGCRGWWYESVLYRTEAKAIEAWNTRSEQAIAATLGRGTCEYAIKDNMNESEGMGDVWIECSACHCAFDYYADEWLMNMHYCPNCGARVERREE